MEYKDYYKTLGLASNATAEDIKKAYRKLMRKHHPDVNKARDAGDKAKEINEAYGVLGDAAKRTTYDALGSRARAGRPFQRADAGAAAHGGSGDDFFSDLFAHVGRRGSAFYARGEDMHASLFIDLADAYHGANRTVTLRVPQRDVQGRISTRERALDVPVPKGVLPGQQVRLAGQGHPGSGGAPPGDLFLEIGFNADARYRVEGRNVYEKLAVAPWEAALGAHIDVPTPSGDVQVSVPPGSQSGRKLRLKGRGIPGHPVGDLYLELEVVLPPASSPKARELYQTMARDLAFNPRAAVRV
ncbi:DnaJ C-terminal domain-containing protein [Massilia sp. TWP1-3-3]|uniref:DnaJ C-terminal domain-containing protein n=1 Tax=Massilia sp. TWP1-3-3 TaxID=2804573 RepID=UPI003CF5DC07